MNTGIDVKDSIKRIYDYTESDIDNKKLRATNDIFVQFQNSSNNFEAKTNY